MYRLACKSREIESACRRPSCVYPAVCPNLNTNHAPLINLYRRARELPGIKKVLIASGVRYDLAIESPEYVKELAQHHTGGYLKIAPEAIGEGPLSKMMKPGVGTYYKFKQLFDRFSQVGRQRAVPDSVLHRGASRHDRRGHARARVVAKEERLPRRPGAGVLAGADGDGDGDVSLGQEPAAADHAHVGSRSRFRKGSRFGACTKRSCATTIRTIGRCCARRLKRMRRDDLIGSGKHQLVPRFQPRGTRKAPEGRRGAEQATAVSHAARSVVLLRQNLPHRDIFLSVTVTGNNP